MAKIRRTRPWYRKPTKAEIARQRLERNADHILGSSQKQDLAPPNLSSKPNASKRKTTAINPRAYKSTPRTMPRTRTDRHGIEWPIITTGPLTDNGLTCITLNNREHADSLGFSWVGRSR